MTCLISFCQEDRERKGKEIESGEKEFLGGGRKGEGKWGINRVGEVKEKEKCCYFILFYFVLGRVGLFMGGAPQTCKGRPRGGFVDLFVASKMYVGVGAAAFGFIGFARRLLLRHRINPCIGVGRLKLIEFNLR